MDTEKKGKTLWEMLQARLHGSTNGAGIAFYNPLDLRTGSAVNVPSVNGPEFAAYDFSVQEIREYTRRLSGQDFTFTDYMLRGVNTKPFDASDAMAVRLRTVPLGASGLCRSRLCSPATALIQSMPVSSSFVQKPG